MQEKAITPNNSQVARHESPEALAAQINLDDQATMVTYGTDTMQQISRFSDELLSRVRAKDAGEAGTVLSDLMLKVKEVDVEEISGKKRSFIEKLPLIGGLFNSVERATARFKSLSEQIDSIGDKLEATMMGLLRDVQVLDELYGHNQAFYQDLNLYIEAGQLRLDQARNEELPALQNAARESGDAMDAQKVRDFADRIGRFERRLHDLQLSRNISLQTAPQIRLIQNNNQVLAEKIQSSILNTIPIWKSQMVLAMSIHGQQNAAKIQESVADATNDMLRRNAAMLEQATVDSARQAERSIVDLATLEETQARLVSTIEETLRIAKEGRESRLAAEKSLAHMEAGLKEKLIELAVRKAHESVGAQLEEGNRPAELESGQKDGNG